MVQVHVFIKGEVIGVGFRAWTKIQAKIHNVKGWVRNNFERHDVFGIHGGVEAVLQGKEDSVNKMLEILRKGSPISRVDDIEVYHQQAKEVFQLFEIKK